MKRSDEVTVQRGTLDGLHYAINASIAPHDSTVWQLRLVFSDDDGTVVEEKHSTLPRGQPLTFEVTRQRLVHLKSRR
jgi:hypothetical protein